MGTKVRASSGDIKFHLWSDVRRESSCSFKEAVTYLKTLPDLIRDLNEGKGVPLVFNLTPLRSVGKKFKLDLNIVFHSIGEENERIL